MVQAVQANLVAVAMVHFLDHTGMAVVPLHLSTAAGLATAHGAAGVHVPQAVAAARKPVRAAVHAPTQALHVAVQAAQAHPPKPRAAAVTPIVAV